MRTSTFSGLTALLALGLGLAWPVAAQDDGLAQIMERELAEVRERISELKDRLDERAAERDRVSADLQAAELKIAEKRRQLEDLEREKSYSEKRLEALAEKRRAR
jgi:septal ring factor EnvC (AmiA/AmiB activator)